MRTRPSYQYTHYTDQNFISYFEADYKKDKRDLAISYPEKREIKEFYAAIQKKLFGYAFYYRQLDTFLIDDFLTMLNLDRCIISAISVEIVIANQLEDDASGEEAVEIKSIPKAPKTLLLLPKASPRKSEPVSYSRKLFSIPLVSEEEVTQSHPIPERIHCLSFLGRK